MKGRSVSVLTSLLLVITFALCAIIEHHHHAADGSVCLCLHMDCHGYSNSEHHHRDCGHNHDDESDCPGCALQIDDFCCKDNLRVKIFAGDFSWDCIIVARVEVGMVNSADTRDFYEFDAPKRKLCDLSSQGLRGPPVNDIFRV